MKALAVFHDYGDGFLQRFLKPGFRHVFVAVQCGDYWIKFDGQTGAPTVEVVAGRDYDLATFYRGEGFVVLETYQRPTSWRYPLAAATCVGMVKAILNVRSTAVTPWRLHQYLRRYR